MHNSAPRPGAFALLLAGTIAATPPRTSAAQPPDPPPRLEAIDRDVWRPFLRGVRRDSAPLYVGVHSPEFHWVAPGRNGRIMDYAEYDDDSRQVMRRRREAGETIEIDIRFLERNGTESFAVERTVTRFVLRRPGRTPETSYGIGHYFLRKERGVWRVLLRYGGTEPATAATFEGATPLPDDRSTPGGGS